MKSFMAVVLETQHCKAIFTEGMRSKICFLYRSMKTVGLGQRCSLGFKGTKSLDSSGLENLKNLELKVRVFLPVAEMNVQN